MFGIGLPELILIMAVALIVVGPEKLPELAKTLARQMLELKKAANTLKESLNEEDEVKPWEKVTMENPQIADYTPKEGQFQQPDLSDAVSDAKEQKTDGADEENAEPEGENERQQ